ncbi:MAG: TenA family protein [Chloroflexota bacterium]
MTERLMPSASDEIRASAAADWQAATDHRLFRQIIDDRVDDHVFERYLRIELGFIDTAAAALGAAVARAPNVDDRTILAAGLHDLLTSQVDFFVSALGTDRTILVPASARGLHLHFDAMIRSGDYAELLATMLAAEWLYQTWCSETLAEPSRRDIIRAWTELHTSPAFIGHVAWLRERIDTLSATTMSAPAAQARLGHAFRRALAAEIRFHDAAYDD